MSPFLVLIRRLRYASGWLWFWSIMALFLTVCVGAGWLCYQQEAMLPRTAQLIENFRDARVNLAQGFLHLTLAGESKSPFRRDVGVAMLNQALAVLGETESQLAAAAKGKSADTGAGELLRAHTAAFRGQMAAYDRASSAAKHGLELPLQVAFHELEDLAQRVDTQRRAELNTLTQRYHSRLAAALIASAVLLGALGASVWQARRRQPRAEAALRQGEAPLRTLVKALPDLVWLKDPRGVYLACNSRFEGFFGAKEAEIVGKTDYDFMARELADFFRTHDVAAVAAGGPRSNEEEVTFAGDGHREILETIKTPMFGEDGKLIGVLGIGRDISGRKRAERAMRQWADAFENCAHGIALGKPGENEIAACNSAFARMIGRPASEIAGRSILDVYDPADHVRIKGHIAEADRTGQVRYESRMVRGDGTMFPVQMDVVSVRDAAGKPTYRVATAQDITRRIAREAEIQRLTRLYATLSQINQAIVRVKTAEELFQQVCDVTAKYGGFKVAWVGRLDPQTQRVVPLARAGDASGYLDEIKVYGDDRPEGRGPTGSCLRAGKPSVINDFLNAAEARPWHAPARAYGLRAAAALPIRVPGEVHGVFTVYDSEANAFQDKEIALLEKAAMDINYAVEHLENKERRERSERTLRERDVLLEEVSRMAHIGGWEFDAATGRGAWTDEIARIHDLDPAAETTVELGLSVYHGESRLKIEAAVSEAVKTGKPYDLELEIITVKGNRKWVRTIGSSDWQGGRVVRVHGAMQDITERKGAEAALRESEANLQNFLNTAAIGLVRNSRDLRYRSVNTAYARLVNRPPDQIVGHSLAEVLGGAALEKIRPYIERVLAGERVEFEAELPYATIGPRWSHVIYAPDYSAEGQIIGWVGSITDISVRKDAEFKLRTEEATLRGILDATTESVFLFSAEGKIVTANETAARRYGRSVSEMVGHNFRELISPELAQTRQARFEEALQSTDPVEFEDERAEVLFHHSLYGIGHESGCVRAVVCYSRDVTARKRAEEALRQSEERVRLKLDSILSPDAEVGEEELVNLLDIPALQSMMDNFSQLCHAVVAILDTKGRVLLSSGWQDICVRFHRSNPETACHCTESDLALSQSVQPGEHVAYHCQNGLWDVVTPLMVGGKHVGNIFTGQFFYEDDVIDEETFVAQADRFGFDRQSYLAALRRVPRVSREWVATLMVFLTKFASLISKSSFNNLKLAKALVQQKRIEEDLRTSEEEFRTMFELASIGMAQAAPQNGQFLRVNQRLSEMTGYSVSELLQMTVHEVAHPEDRERDSKQFDRVLRGETAEYHLEERYLRKDGRVIWVNVNMSLLQDTDGRPVRTMATIEDITERKRLEQERSVIEGQLRQQQKLESLGTLAGGVAHEINNPINGILNYAQLIQDRLPGESPLAEFTGEIMHETQRVATIVRNLLTFARDEKQNHSPARIVDIVEAVLSLVRTVIRHDQIILNVSVSPDLPLLKCRSQQIQQVIMNLMTNSRDALGERYPGYNADKILDLKARLLEKDARRWIRITVEDHGTGIPNEVRERMFDPFFTTKGRDKGTGLGLSISHGIVKEHHGELTVESEPGRFTRMHVDLPVDNGWQVGSPAEDESYET